MKQFLRIDRSILKANNSEAYLLALIAFTSSISGKECSRSYYAECMNTTVNYIKDLIASLINKGLISSKLRYDNNIYGQVKSKARYTIVETKSWFKIRFNFILDNIGDPVLLGFILRVRALAWDDTFYIKGNKKQMAKSLDIGYSSLLANLKKAEKIGFKLIPFREGYTIVMDNQYFIENEVNHLSEQNQGIAENVLSDPNNGKLYKQVKWFMDRKVYLLPDANKIFDEIMAGVLNYKPRKNEFETFEFK